MEELVSVSVVLSAVARIEDGVARLYGFYEEVFSDDPSARTLFAELKKEELDHKNRVLMHKRIVDRSPASFGSMVADLEMLRSVAREIDDHIQGGVFDLGDALMFALGLENGQAERFYKEQLATQKGELASLARLLTNGDDSHARRLQGLLASSR